MGKDIEKEIDREIVKRVREPRIKDSDLFETVEEVFDRSTVLAVLELFHLTSKSLVAHTIFSLPLNFSTYLFLCNEKFMDFC